MGSEQSTPHAVRHLRQHVRIPGRYGDGRGGLGLGLLARPALRGGLNKPCTQSVRIDGRPTSLGLGRYPVVTLAMAHERALENARAIAEALETVIAIHAPNWKDRPGSERQWRSSLATYALPRIGGKTVDAVTSADVMAVLLPIWSTRRDRRTRQAAHRRRDEVGGRAGPARRQPRRRRDLRRAAEDHDGAAAPAGAATR